MSFPFRTLSQQHKRALRVSDVRMRSPDDTPRSLHTRPLFHCSSSPNTLGEYRRSLQVAGRSRSNKCPEDPSQRHGHHARVASAAPQQNTIGSALVVIRTADTPSRQRPDNPPPPPFIISGLVAPITRIVVNEQLRYNFCESATTKLPRAIQPK